MTQGYLELFQFFVKDRLLNIHKSKFKVVHRGFSEVVSDKAYSCTYKIESGKSEMDIIGSTFQVAVTKDLSLGTLNFRVVDTTADVPRTGIVMNFHKGADGELFFYGVEESTDQQGSGWLFGSLMAAFLAWEAWYGYDLYAQRNVYVVRATENAQEQEWVV